MLDLYMYLLHADYYTNGCKIPFHATFNKMSQEKIKKKDMLTGSYVFYTILHVNLH